MDSILSMGHNYYMYLSPKSNRFAFIPWDLNEAFGAFMMAGSGDDQIQASIGHPHATPNRLIECVLAVPEFQAQYLKHMADLIAGPMSPQKIEQQSAAIEAACRAVMEEEKKPQAGIRPAGMPSGPGGMMGPGRMNKPDVRQFVARCVESIAAQLAGKSEGKILEARRPGAWAREDRRLLAGRAGSGWSAAEELIDSSGGGPDAADDQWAGEASSA